VVCAPGAGREDRAAICHCICGWRAPGDHIFRHPPGGRSELRRAPLGARVSELFRQKMLAFIAGDLIYVGAEDLLPEAHRRFNWRVVVSVIAGFNFMLLLELLGPLA
jgi:hypothetical protein